MLPIANVANCQCCQLPMLPIANLFYQRVSFHNLVNPVNPVKKLCLSAFVPSVDGKQLFETTCLWRTGELARVHFPSQNRMDMLRWSRKSAGELSRAPLQSCFYKLSKLFPILNRMGEGATRFLCNTNEVGVRFMPHNQPVGGL